jgi:hypothetical protein
MTILPEPAHFKRQDYNKFLQDYPHAKMVLASSYVSEEGEQIPLTKDIGDEVLVYVGLLSEEQKTSLGNAALKELNKHFAKTGTKARFALVFGLGVVSLSILAGLIWWAINGPPNGGEPTPTPSSSSTAVPASTSKPTATPRRRPTSTPVYRLPTPTPIPTSTPIPTPTPAFTPTPTVVFVPRLTDVKLQDENGAFIPAIDGVYSLKPLETVTIWPELDNPSNLDVKIEYAPALGTINANTYIAPDRPGRRDMITLQVFDNTTGKKIFDTFITIKIIATQ